MSGLLLDGPTIDAIADRVAAKMLARSRSIMAPRAAMEYAGFRSLAAFYAWAKRKRVRPLERGRYSARRLDVAMGTGGAR